MSAGSRDVRLDFFRGVGLLFIFMDHIPGNAFSYLTLSNIVFSDAAEIFVFISGYTAAAVFGGVLAREGPLFASVQILKRCWTLYVAHVFVFVIFTAQVSWTAQRFANPMFVDELNVTSFLEEPHVAVLQALVLRFQPAFMNILPLYIVLLLALGALLPLFERRRGAVVGASLLLYAAAQVLHFNLATYPGGVWYFNPFAWQALFFIGAALGYPWWTGAPAFLARRSLAIVSALVLGLCVAIRVPLTVLDLLEVSPGRLTEAAWLIGDKTNLGPLRLVNFLALAHVTVTLFGRDHSAFGARWAAPIIGCGQNSLNIFCLGIFLSYLAHLTLVEIDHSLIAQLLVNAAGVAMMFATARFLAWSKGRPRARAAGTGVTPSEGAAQGGE